MNTKYFLHIPMQVQAFTSQEDKEIFQRERTSPVIRRREEKGL